MGVGEEDCIWCNMYLCLLMRVGLLEFGCNANCHCISISISISISIAKAIVKSHHMSSFIVIVRTSVLLFFLYKFNILNVFYTFLQ